MSALFRLAELIPTPSGHHVAAVVDEVDQQLLQVQDLGLTIHDRQVDDAEGGLQRRHGEQLVQHDLTHGAALQLDVDAHTLTIALVSQVADAIDLLVTDQLGDALQ